MKTINFFWAMILTLSATAQNVNIPDTNFRNALLAHGNTITDPNISNIDTNNDGVIQISEAQAYTETIDVRNQNISDLTGIEEFTSATRLYCFGNSLTSLDVSQNPDLISILCYNNDLTSLTIGPNTDLIKIECQNNNLTSLDVSQSDSLIWLFCQGNDLTSLDVSQNTVLKELFLDNNSLSNLDVSQNTALTKLSCYDNSLTSLDVSQNSGLTLLYCHFNYISSLDVSQNTSLDVLECHYNQLNNLDISQNNLLTRLYCYSNSLTSLDVSNNVALTYLRCQNNSLNSLDVSQNSALIQLRCQNNSLNSLNLANGNNSSISSMWAHQNPNLTCIQYDSGFDPNSASGWQKDTIATWENNCGCMVTSSTDVQEHYCSDFTWINGNTYTQNTIAQDTLTNVAGCDSIVTLNLTILQSISTYDTLEHCESFTWTDGVTYTQDTMGVQDTLVSTAGCDSIVTLNLTIHSAPTVSLAFLNDELIVTGADSIEWYFDGNLMPNENNDTLVPLNNGGYYVIGYSENGCSSISNAISVAGLSVKENSWSNFTMFPNPTNGTVEIQSDAKINTIEIINNLGQKVGEFNQNQFDISNLKNGVYFVKVTTEIGTSTKRLIKQ